MTAVRRVESTFTGHGGLRMLRRAWLPDAPERVLVLVHGYAEHSGRYDHVGVWFAERGFAVHAYDQRGHGRSEGARGHVDRFADFLEDLERLIAVVREAHPGLPVTLFGHSMGGLVVSTLLVERDPLVHHAVLSGAALSVADAVPAWRVRAARLLRRLAPTRSMASGLDLDGLSRDPEVLRAYLEDPLVFRTMTMSLAGEMLDASARTARSAHRVGVPVLLLHGEEDPLCAARGSEAFAADLRVAGHGLRIYPGLRHEILNEPEREEVMTHALEWLDEKAANR